MLRDKLLLCPTASNAVHRLLEQEKDGSLLYSRWNHSSQVEEIRLFNAASLHDKLIFINYTGLEIVNASLNPSGDVIAFTTLSPSKTSRDVVLPGLESVSSDNDSGSDDVSTVCDQSDSSVSERSSWRGFYANSTGNYEKSPEIEPAEPFLTIKGRYVTHLADVHPVSWMKRFDISRAMYQKVIFTDCDVTKKDGAATYRENRLLLIMNRKWVGLYSILLQPKQSRTGSESSVGATDQKWRMLSPPKSLVLARKPLWVQWNAASQRLYYVTVSKYRGANKEPLSSYSTSLSCEQLVQSESWTQKMFSIKISLNLKLDTIRERPSIYLLRDMDDTVTSLGVNMKILELDDGGLCLAWQTLFYANDDTKSLYKIALIDKNNLLTAFTKTIDWDALDEIREPCLSFASCGNNVFVKGNDKFSFLHCIAADCVTCETSCFRYPCHYMSLKCQFVKLGDMSQLPFHDYPRNKDCNSIGVYDATKKTIHSLSVDPGLVRDMYFDNTVSLTNRLAATRFGRSATINDNFRDILLHFASTDMILDGEQFLGTHLIHYVSEEICSEFSDVPFLSRLLPFGIRQTRDDENFYASSECLIAEDDVATQVLQAVDDRAEIVGLWDRTVAALKSSHYEPYDLGTITEDYDILTSSREGDSAVNDNLRKCLENIYENEISKTFEKRRRSVVFAQMAEDDRLRKCIMALIYKSLNRHLARFIQNDVISKQIAVAYVITQQSAVDHYMNLFLFLNIDNGKGRSLFQPISGSEWKLLQLLKRLLDGCVTINFPFPADIQTYLACLSFRHLLAIHQTHQSNESNSNSDSSNAYVINDTKYFNGIDVSWLTFEFVQLIDTKCVQVTSAFVAQLLEDVPDHVTFESLIHEILSRSEFSSDKIFDCMLQQWEHPYARFCSARNTMKALSRACATGEGGKTHARKGSIVPKRDATNFEPLDIFLDNIRHTGEKFDISVTSVEAATMQCTTAKYGVDSLRDIAH